MKLDKWKFKIACARACMTRKDVGQAAALNNGTMSTALNRGVNPATIGKIAKALGVDVLDIIETEE
ncbi:MAG: helix-turn-helix domain-containing protein [Clostridia bacterium]|nr:helix-turn-helix domain-containing protein [Clostridia bacterium]